MIKDKTNKTVILEIILLVYFFFYLSLFITDYSFIHHHVSINNIIAPSFVLALLFFFRWWVDKKNFKNSAIINFFLKLKEKNDKNLIFLSCGFIFAFFSTISIIRHLSLNSEGYDLGIFDQAVWNVTQGNSLSCTIKYPYGGTLLGDHFEPILFFIAPLYLLWSNALVLLILQSFLLASCIIPLYLIAKSVLKDRFIIFAFLICYILSKPVRGIVYFDFYPESFVVPALFWGYYFLIKRNNMLLSLSLLVLLLCKEDMTFIVLGFGLFTLLFQERKSLGISFIILSVFLWWLETSFITPYFAPTHTYQYLSKLPFGPTYLDNFKFCFLHPLSFLKFIFMKEKIDYIMRLFGPLGFLSLLSPPHFILIFIPLLKNLLGTPVNNLYYVINAHYVADIIPFVFISAIYGAHALLQKLKIKKNNIIVGLFLISFGLFFYGRTDGNRIADLLNNMKSNHTLEKIKSLDLIPPDASVLATNNLCPHLSHRKYIFVWDPKGEQSNFPSKMPEYLAVDKTQLAPDEIITIDGYLNLAERNGYKIISTLQNNNFIILTSPKN